MMSRDFGPEGMGNVWGQIAVIAASASYATAITFSRRYLRNQPPVLQAAMVVLIADGLLWLAAPIAERPFHLPALPITWIALAWLGLLGSCLAYLLFFFVMNAWGPTRASVVTYVFPVIGLILGIIFLRETPDWRLLAGALLIVGGIAVINVQTRPRLVPSQAAAD